MNLGTNKESETKNSLPEVSIGLPTCNGARFLRETIESLLAQDYPNIKIFISDNASTDETPAIIAEYTSRYPFITSQRNSVRVGAGENFNRVYNWAQGKYYMWAADHDRWSPDLVSEAVSALESRPDAVMAAATARWLNVHGTDSGMFEPPLDTTAHPTRMGRLMYLIWRLLSCHQFYGIYRKEALDKVMPIKDIFAFDLSMVWELTCLGHILALSKARFYLRQLEEHGDFSAQARKCGLPLTSSSPMMFYIQFMKAHIDIVFRHFKDPLDRIYLVVGLMTCILLRYSWIPDSISRACVRDFSTKARQA